MKLIKITIVLVLGLSCIDAQVYKSAFRQDICGCLQDEKLKLRLTENSYKKCFQEILPKYATQIDASIVEEDPTKKFTLGQLARRDLMFVFQYELIYTCDVYFGFVESIRIGEKLIARENAKESELERYDQLVAMTPSASAYIMRAELQFRLGNLEASEADIKKSLELNPNGDNMKSARKESLLLAWIYEEQERYTEAIDLYDKIYLGVYDTKVATFRAIVDRKSGGSIANIPELKEKKEKSGQVSQNRKTRRNQRASQTSKKNNQNLKKNTKKKDSSSLRRLFKIDQ